MADIERKLLIGIDGSPHASRAVEYVARNFSPVNTRVNLMNVQPAAPNEVFWQVNLDEDFKRSMMEKYDEARARCSSEAMKSLQSCKSVLFSAGFSDSSVGIIGQECKQGIARDIIAESASRATMPSWLDAGAWEKWRVCSCAVFPTRSFKG